MAKAYDKARYAFERAATGQERQSSPWQAGKLLEQAASCAKETGDLTNVTELTRSGKHAFEVSGLWQQEARLGPGHFGRQIKCCGHCEEKGWEEGGEWGNRALPLVCCAQGLALLH